MRFAIHFFASSMLVAILALSGCSSNGTLTTPRSMSLQSASLSHSMNGPHVMLVHPDKIHNCPRSQYSLGCVVVRPSGKFETTTFSCSGGSDCPVPQWTMFNVFYSVKNQSARRDFIGKWDPNPYHSRPSTHTTNSISERRPLKPSNRVEYYEVLIACPAQSSCTGLGGVGIIPR